LQQFQRGNSHLRVKLVDVAEDEEADLQIFSFAHI
jgi:hypothetical protein